MFRYSTGIHVKRAFVKGILNAGFAGFMGGGSAGAVSGVFHGLETGDWSTISTRIGHGALQGTMGALIAHSALSGVDKLTKRSWDNDRKAYWKNEAKNNPGSYSDANVTRMKQGLAPTRVNPTTGQIESMELHHDLIPQRSGLPRCLIDQKFNLRKVWPDEHKAIDIYRN